MRILLVDDDELLLQVLASNLTAQLHAVDIAMDGEAGWDYAQAAAYDLIVLDVNLPKLDGIRLCQRLRQNGYIEPILLLTAKGESADKVIGLDSGADDYVVKPCSVEELSARIRALLRRQYSSSSPVLEWGDLCLTPSTCTVTFKETELSLSAKEYSLLELFMRNPQRVFSSNLILEHLWGFEDTPGAETVRTHIKRLRRKLKSAGAEEVIDTVYGIGYRLKPLSEVADPNTLTKQLPAETVSANTSVNSLEQTKAERAREAAIALWEIFKQPALERVAILDQAVSALQAGYLTEELLTQAEQAAHKLAGSLSMFGFPGGSRIGRDIEHWLQSASQAAEVGELKSLVTHLHQELAKSPALSSDADWVASLVDGSVHPEEQVYLPQWITIDNQFSRRPKPEIMVLVVDDDPLVLETLNQFLPQWGIRSVLLSVPHRLLEVLQTTKPDLLILDVEMPHINGIKLCQMIRRDRTWDGLPILFLTACKKAETVHYLYSAGADDYIAKPFTEQEIVTRIFNRLERNRRLRGLDQLSTETI